MGSCPGTDIDPEWQSFKFAPLEIWSVEIQKLSLVHKLNVNMCGLLQYPELNLKYIIFLCSGFISNYEYAQGSLTFC